LYALFLPQTLSLSNKIFIFLYSIFVAHIDYILSFVKISYDLEREREREREIIVFFKYVDNNYLTSRLLQNLLLEESSVDEVYTNS